MADMLRLSFHTVNVFLVRQEDRQAFPRQYEMTICKQLFQVMLVGNKNDVDSVHVSRKEYDTWVEDNHVLGFYDVSARNRDERFVNVRACDLTVSFYPELLLVNDTEITEISLKE